MTTPNQRLERPEMNVEKTIEVAGHSETLVRRLVTAGVHSEEIHKTIKRNTDHLGIILKKQPIIDSNSPSLDGLREAIALGEAFISAE